MLRLVYARLTYPRSAALSLSASLALWWIFRPGVYSRDAFYLLLDAWSGWRSDVHPLLIPQVLSLVFKAGGNIAWITAAQLLLGSFGLRELVLSVAQFIGVERAQSRDWIAVAVIVLLVTPLTPLALYLATLWSDTWLAIILLWVISLVLELYAKQFSVVGVRVRLIVLIILLAGIVLVRYNAVVLYPFVSLALGTAMSQLRLSWRNIALYLIAPLLLAAGFLSVVYHSYRIVRFHPERAVYALDLASMIKYDPDICGDLSLMSCDLVLHDFSPQFVPGHGAIDLTFTQNRADPYEPFLRLFFYPRLETEFKIAAFDHPWLLLTVDVLNVLDYVGVHPGQFYFQQTIVQTDAALMPRQKYASPAGPWFSVSESVISNPDLRWFSYIHAPWLVLNLLGLLVAAALYFKSRRPRKAFFWMILLIPASYYASYLVAFTTAEFRFMYPSMLIMQVLALSLVAGLIAKRWETRASFASPSARSR